jgi:DNA polymerase (family X)
MENKAIASLLYETADLLEIDGQDVFRIRSYRRAAEAIDAMPQQVRDLIQEPKKLLEVPGIGKGMLLNLQELFASGKIPVHEEMLAKYKPSMLDLLKIQGLGPKTIALIWSAYQVADVDGVEKLAQEGKIRTLPRMGEKHEQKLLKAIESYRKLTGRFLISTAAETADALTEHLAKFPGIEKTTPAGSLRRGRETVGDLDLLVTGKACETEESRQKVMEHILLYPGITDVIARGDNKISFHLRNHMQVDVRLLAAESFGAALVYFTGSKSHNILLRQRALKMGFTLNEYDLARLDDEKNMASRTEEDIYKALKLDYIPPELRESLGEIEAAEKHTLPELITVEDLRGDVHMHTIETDGKNTIEEMAEAARERGYEFMAITDHSKNLAMANGLDDKRAVEHIARIREVDRKLNEKATAKKKGIRVLAGIEVDILADGTLDLSDSVLEQMDVVIASVHSHFNQEAQEMTDRLLKAISNKNVSILGHPTGRQLLRRDAYPMDMEAVLDAAARANVAMELNSYPERLDLNDRHLRMAKERGVKIVINTDSHHTSHMSRIRYGVLQARRAWLTRDDVLNTLPTAKFLKALAR